MWVPLLRLLCSVKRLPSCFFVSLNRWESKNNFDLNKKRLVQRCFLYTSFFRKLIFFIFLSIFTCIKFIKTQKERDAVLNYFPQFFEYFGALHQLFRVINHTPIKKYIEKWIFLLSLHYLVFSSWLIVYFSGVMSQPFSGFGTHNITTNTQSSPIFNS